VTNVRVDGVEGHFTNEPGQTSVSIVAT